MMQTLSFPLLLLLPLLANSANVLSPFLDPQSKVDIELEEHVEQTYRTIKELKMQAILQQHRNRRTLEKGVQEETVAYDSEDMYLPQTEPPTLRRKGRLFKSEKKSKKGSSSDGSKVSKIAKKVKKGTKTTPKNESKKKTKSSKQNSSADSCECAEQLDSEDVPTVCDCDDHYSSSEYDEDESGSESEDGSAKHGSAKHGSAKHGSAKGDIEDYITERTTTGYYEFVMVRDAIGTPSAGEEYGINSSIGLNGLIFEMVHLVNGDTTFGDEPIGNFHGVCTVVSDEPELLCKYDLHLYTHGPNEYASAIISSPITVSGEDTGIVTGTAFDFSGFRGGSLTTHQDEDLPLLYAYLTLE